jgi:uncharacterized protein
MITSGCALITGASSGIGECFARVLAARGMRLALVARSKEKLEALADELRLAHGIDVVVLPADLCLERAAERLAGEVQNRRLEITLLINNAAFGARGEFWRLPLGRQSEMLRLNIHAVVELTYRLVPAMIVRHEGAIINVSSTASFQPVPYTTTYGGTKGFITSFSMALQEELRPYGVRVVTLCPGATRTNFFQAGSYGQRSIPGGMQAPEEVVEAALQVLDSGGLVVPRLINKFSVFIQRFVPRAAMAKLAAGIFRPHELKDK